jgi:hypothetical protein
VDDRLHQQALGIDKDMALLALDLLPGVVTTRIVGPPFSAILTLWLSMIVTVGLAPRPACSRHRLKFQCTSDAHQSTAALCSAWRISRGSRSKQAI